MAELVTEGLTKALGALKLVRTAEQLETLLQDGVSKQMTYAAFLEHVLSAEARSKTSKQAALRITLAKFPYVKTLDGFDFAFQPSVDRGQVDLLAQSRYVANGDNVILLGPPGVGKTHLAIALGVKACEAGYRVLFTTAATLVRELKTAFDQHRLDARLKSYADPKLLIVDELGYLPLDRTAATLLFQLVVRRYEKGSLIVTSNLGFSSWDQVFGDPVLATAVLDRLLHHSHILNIKGDSFRLKEKKRAGLLTHPQAASPKGEGAGQIS